MATLHGKAGSLTFSGLTAGVESWTLDIDDEQEEVTTFTEAGSGYHNFVSGIGRWTVAVNCGLDGTVAPLAKGASGAITLTTTGTRAWTGTAILNSISAGVPHNGKETINYTFNGKSALVATTFT
jgi:hypothetical protein